MNFTRLVRMLPVAVVWSLLFVAGGVSARARDTEEARPDAVIVADPEPKLLATLVPALHALGNRPLLVYAKEAEAQIAEFLATRRAREVWLFDPRGITPEAWRAEFRQPLKPTESPTALLPRLFPDVESAVIVDDARPETLFDACQLACLRRLPLVVRGGTDDERAATLAAVRRLAPQELIGLGAGRDFAEFAEQAGARATTWDGERLATELRAGLGDRPAEHLVAFALPVERPVVEDEPPIVPLPPLLAVPYVLQHRAAVAWVDPRRDAEEQIRDRLEGPWASVKYVTLWGSDDELPDGEVLDPVNEAGLATKLKSPTIYVQPLNRVPTRQPCQFRVGRFTADTAATVSLVIARALHPLRSAGPPQAVILANADLSLPLLETIVRATAQTFERRGWRTNAFYGRDVASYRAENKPWGGDLFLFEGHTADLRGKVQFDPERDRLQPGLYVFQGCRSLRQREVQDWLRNGATGVVGTMTLTYSASGGAFAKTYVDSLLFDGHDAGTSLMIARNFMLAMADLKEKRGLKQSPKLLRAGTTFTLWGDPTWRPPETTVRVPDDERVRAVRTGDAIELRIPEELPASVTVEHYSAQSPLGSKYAGMYEWEDEDKTRRQLPPLYFGVVSLPDYGPSMPRIRTTLADNRWTTLWDSRNRWLYLLVQSGTKFDGDLGKKLTFRLEPRAKAP